MTSIDQDNFRHQGETSKLNFCGHSFPDSLTKSNYIVCDFCRSLTELSRLSYIALCSKPRPLTFFYFFYELSQKSQKQLTNISLKDSMVNFDVYLNKFYIFQPMILVCFSRREVFRWRLLPGGLWCSSSTDDCITW